MIGPRSLVDLPWRLAYRAAYQLLRLWWRVRRPAVTGANVALWRDGRVLVVRTSYRGDLLDLPGGGVERGEEPADAAARELAEEVGLEVPAAALERVASYRLRADGRRITDHVFEPREGVAPTGEATVDGREIVWAGWMTPDELAGRRKSGALRRYLGGRRAPPAG